MNPSAHYRLSSSVVSRQIGDELLIVPVRNETATIDCMYSLNSMGARILELMDGSRRLDEVPPELVGEFEVSLEVAQRDALAFLEELDGLRLLEEA